MDNRKKMLKIAMAGIVSLSILTITQQSIAKDSSFVKCYGVAAANKNDCATTISACAASIKTGGACYAWIYAPKGICEKIVNASIGKQAGNCKSPQNSA